MIRHAVIVFALWLAGCANPYADNYQATPHPRLATAPAPATTSPRLVKSLALDEDSRRLAEEGYAVIGRSGFNSDEIPDRLALRQGQAIGDEVILLWRRHTGTYPYTSASTLPETHTDVVPDSQGRPVAVSSHSYRTEYDTFYIRHYDYVAVYWGRRTPDPLGADLRDLNVEERQKLRTNQGAAVAVVVKRTPAFFANLIVGDVITAIDGIPVVDAAQAAELIEQRRGRKTAFLCNGRTMEVTLAP